MNLFFFTHAGNLNCAGKSKKPKTPQGLSELEKKATDAVDAVNDKLNSLPNGDSNGIYIHLKK